LSSQKKSVSAGSGEGGEREREGGERERERTPTAKHTLGVGDILLIKKKHFLLKSVFFFYIIEMYKVCHREAAVKMYAN
jgi:hypothetical protein